MENTVLERSYNEIISYIGKYENNVSKNNAKEVINLFKEEWVNTIENSGEDYGNALIVYSKLSCYLKELNSLMKKSL